MLIRGTLQIRGAKRRAHEIPTVIFCISVRRMARAAILDRVATPASDPVTESHAPKLGRPVHIRDVDIDRPDPQHGTSLPEHPRRPTVDWLAPQKLFDFCANLIWVGNGCKPARGRPRCQGGVGDRYGRGGDAPLGGCRAWAPRRPGVRARCRARPGDGVGWALVVVRSRGRPGRRWPRRGSVAAPMGVVVERDGGPAHQCRSAGSYVLGHRRGTSPALWRVAGRPGPSVGPTAPPGARDGPDNGATRPVQLRRGRWRRGGPRSARRLSPAGVGGWGMGSHFWPGPSVGRTGSAGRHSSAGEVG